MRDPGSTDDAITEPGVPPSTQPPSTPTADPSTPASWAPGPSTPTPGAERRDFADLWPSLTSPAPTAGSPARAATESTPPPGSSAPAGGPGEAGAPPTPEPRRDRARDRGGPGSGPIVFGLLLILGGSFLLARELMPELRVAQVWPVVVIVVGAALILLAFVRGPRQRPR